MALLTYHKKLKKKPNVYVGVDLAKPEEENIPADHVFKWVGDQWKLVPMTKPIVEELVVGELVEFKPTPEKVCLQLPTAEIAPFVMQQIEGYLAHNWACTDKLPPDHPYKFSKPVLPFHLSSSPMHNPFKFQVGKYQDQYEKIQYGDGY